MFIPIFRNESRLWSSHCYKQAYDSHCNLVLGDVEETIFVVEEDDEDEETMKVGNLLRFTRVYSNASLQTIKKQSEMLFVRGESRCENAIIVSLRASNKFQETRSY